MKYIFLLFLLSLVHLQASTLTVTAVQRCPYTCENNSDEQGFLVDIVRHIFKQEGYDLEYTLTPSKQQAIEDVRNHKFDALIGVDRKEATGFIFAKSPLAYSYDVILVPKASKWKYRSESSLNGLILGAVEERSYTKEIDQYIDLHKDNPKKVQLLSGEYALKHNLNKLRFDKITGLIGDRSELRYFYFKQKKPLKFKAAYTYQKQPIQIAFSPTNYKSKKYASIFYKGLQKLKGTPEMKKILDAYGLSETYIQALK